MQAVAPSIPYERPPTPTYRRAWFVFWALFLGFFGFKWWSDWNEFRSFSGSRNLTGPGSAYFMVLRMPEIPWALTDADIVRRLFLSRVQALHREGFKPVLLTDIRLHQQGRGPLPAKPVVLLFDPGHRHTYDMLAPVLRDNRIPAVWLTDGAALDNGDRRYVSRHELQKMSNTGLWDVGWYEEGQPIVIRNRLVEPWTLAPDRSELWSPAAGVFALNRGLALKKLNRLNVNSRWTAEEFVDRVQAEVPVREPTRLGGRLIGNHFWGITLPMRSGEDSRFSLESRLEKRGKTVSWLGTSGVRDMELQVSMQNVAGEAWVIMRSDEDTNESLNLCLTRGMAFLEQQQGEKTERLATGSTRAGARINAVIRLEGDTLRLNVNGRPVFTARQISPPTSDRGMVRLAVYDKLRGTAKIDNVQMTITPLGT